VMARTGRSVHDPGKPARAPELPKALRGVHRLVLLGDSITEQGAERGGYVWLLERWLAVAYPAQPIQCVNAGISGHRSPDMLARFRADVLERRPDLVAINVGVNDVWHAFHDWATGFDHPKGDLPAGVPVDAYRSNVAAMVGMADDAGIRTILLSPTLVHEDLQGSENRRLVKYVRAERDVARSRGCLFIDLNAAFRRVVAAWRRHAGPARNLLTTDGVHLNDAGNHLMAATILCGLGARVDVALGPEGT